MLMTRNRIAGAARLALAAAVMTLSTSALAAEPVGQLKVTVCGTGTAAEGFNCQMYMLNIGDPDVGAQAIESSFVTVEPKMNLALKVRVDPELLTKESAAVEFDIESKEANAGAGAIVIAKRKGVVQMSANDKFGFEFMGASVNLMRVK